MSAISSIIKERRKNNYKLISELQEARRQVWALYCKIGESKPFSSLSETQSLVTHFSQLLVDYISLGHFGIYERLLKGTERRTLVLEAAEKIYPQFSEITDAVVSFNDKYDHHQDTFKVNELESDLSFLGENLAKRIDLEDELCRHLG